MASAGHGDATSPDLRIAECEPGPATESLRAGDADLAVVHAYSLLPRDLPNGCERHHLMDEPVLLALSPGRAARHGLAPGQSADLAVFAEADWLLPGPETSCHELPMRACGTAGFVPHPVAVASDFFVLTALVAAEAGVALIPHMALPADTGDVSLHLVLDTLRQVSAEAG